LSAEIRGVAQPILFDGVRGEVDVQIRSAVIRRFGSPFENESNLVFFE